MLTRLTMIWAVTGVAAAGERFHTVVAPVGPDNPRNSEAAIFPLKDGSLLLGWTEFYAGSAADRLSVVFFHHPNYDAEIACIPTCTGDDNPPKYPPVKAGEYLVERFDATYSYRQG